VFKACPDPFCTDRATATLEYRRPRRNGHALLR
jgi:hypothetical protein